MAKHKAKASAPASKAKGPLDSAGWGFWLISFTVLAAPSWYLANRVTVDDMRGTLIVWITAFVLAALGAGLLSVAVNYVLGARAAAALKARTAESKKSKRGRS